MLKVDGIVAEFNVIYTSRLHLVKSSHVCLIIICIYMQDFLQHVIYTYTNHGRIKVDDCWRMGTEATWAVKKQPACFGSHMKSYTTLSYSDFWGYKISLLVGGWTNPFEKYARQIGLFPQVGMKIKYLKPPPRLLLLLALY